MSKTESLLCSAKRFAASGTSLLDAIEIEKLAAGRGIQYLIDAARQFEQAAQCLRRMEGHFDK